MGDQEGVVPAEEVRDDEVLLRLTWWPHDFDDSTGVLLPAAFRRDDFSGPGEGVSVDRKHLAQKEVIAKVVAEQQPKMPTDRVTAHLSSANVLPIRAAAGEAGPSIFVVSAEPIEGVNPAHAYISSRSTRTKSQRNEARLELIKYFGTPVKFETYFESQTAEA